MAEGNKIASVIEWPHAPKHVLEERGAFCVTAATYRKEHFFAGAERLEVVQRGLLKLAKEYGWQLEAWAIFPNHYHFVANSPADPENLRQMCRELHSRLARWINRRDGTLGRRVWHEFWDTLLTTDGSYFARLNYVHQNAVHHGIVAVARDYPYCSARWFETHASQSQVKRIYAVKTDKVTIPDDF